jgi:hypothetical protein
MFNPFIDLMSNIIFLINLALIIWVVLGLLIHFDIVNRYNPLVTRVYGTLGRLLDESVWSTRCTSCSMIGPSSRSAVT